MSPNICFCLNTNETEDRIKKCKKDLNLERVQEKGGPKWRCRRVGKRLPDRQSVKAAQVGKKLLSGGVFKKAAHVVRGREGVAE